MRTRHAGPLSPLAMAALAVAVAGWGCSREADTYRGPRFEIHKPSAPGWTLTAKPEEFRIKPPAAPEDTLDVAGAKTVEMFHEGLKATIEIYLVPNAASQADQVAAVLERRGQRKGYGKATAATLTVGGKPATASTVAWKQTRDTPKQWSIYRVHVALGDDLWCFVGTVERKNFRAARNQFTEAIKSVQFR